MDSAFEKNKVDGRKGSHVSSIGTDGRKSSVTRDISMLEFSKEIRKRNQKIEESLAKRAMKESCRRMQQQQASSLFRTNTCVEKVL